MSSRTIFYATNRKHEGNNRFEPKRYGTTFSSDGLENLRFGKVSVPVDENKIKASIGEDTGFGKGDGEKLAGYFKECTENAEINAYEEKIDHQTSDTDQSDATYGSLAMLKELKGIMKDKTDVLIYIHGFDVAWEDAVGSALSLQEMLSTSSVRDNAQKIQIILFTWPSNGRALPFVSYKSDRTDAKTSGYAFGRGLLKVRDFLAKIKKEDRPGGEKLCGQDIHLLCHSMGNYVLKNTLKRIAQFTPGKALPRIFEHIFLCAADVDEDVLEQDKGMGRLHEICRHATVYHNKGDLAMYVSDYTKGHPERLGSAGASHPFLLHNKIHQVDCSPIVKGIIEHSYYHCGHVHDDIRLSIDGVPFDDRKNLRVKNSDLPNVWAMKK